jgi:hypothetical protein
VDFIIKLMDSSPLSASKRPEDEVQDDPEDAESSGDEDEEEPQLKYERIDGDIAKVVRGDLISSFCVGSKIIVHSK